MTRPLTDPGDVLEREIGLNRFEVQRQVFMPGAFPWRTPDIDDPPPTGPTPELETGWAQPSPPLERFAYRLHTDGSLEFKGHLDASGASSGTVALTLPEADDDLQEPSYRLSRDQYFHTVITPDDGVTFQMALVFIKAATGEVTITWPIS